MAAKSPVVLIHGACNKPAHSMRGAMVRLPPTTARAGASHYLAGRHSGRFDAI
jgi:hypothetical protein